MEDLLNQWSELEPNVCFKSDPLPFKNGRLWMLGYVSYNLDDLALEEEFGHALIQYAVQKAISAHGWDYDLRRIGNDYCARLYYKFKRISYGINVYPKETISTVAAKALLYNYIQALKQEKNLI